MKIWQLAKGGQKQVPASEDSLSPLAATLLANRDLSDAQTIESFLHPEYARDTHDPYLFTDMRKVVDRVFLAIEQGERLAIFGDYDADGVCSSVVLTVTLRELGGIIADVYLPHREKEGYGLNVVAVEQFARQGVTLLMTLDCGTTNTAEIVAAKKLGIDVIVIDHHHVPDELPGAFALLNPKMPSETYPFRYLASVGMAFKVSQALLQEQRRRAPQEIERLEAFEKWLLDLVAIATVTDLVPLVGENRTLLKYGLITLNKTRRVGLLSLIKEMGGKLGALDTQAIAFQIGPRINAAGRMNHANAAYALLTCEDDRESAVLAKSLNEENQRRQQRTEELTAEARSQVESQLHRRVLVAVGDGWPVGLVGLVASRLMETYHRPVLVIGRTDHGLTGSGRSIPTFNIIEALHRTPELFVKFGGHAQACGFTVKDDASLARLAEALNEFAEEVLTEEDLKPVLTIDAALLLRDVQWSTYETVQLFEPFGMNNPKPKFLFSRVQVVGLGTVGSANQHLKLTLSDEQGTIRQAIGFRIGEWETKLRLGDSIDVVAELAASEWNGNRELQLKIVDLRPALPL